MFPGASRWQALLITPTLLYWFRMWSIGERRTKGLALLGIVLASGPRLTRFVSHYAVFSLASLLLLRSPSLLIWRLCGPDQLEPLLTFSVFVHLSQP